MSLRVFSRRTITAECGSQPTTSVGTWSSFTSILQTCPGGCTRQARSFQSRLADLKAAGVTVVGVSGDSVHNHQLFKRAHALRFPLLADEDGKVAEAFGVPVRKGGRLFKIVNGKKKLLVRGVTAQRWTFVIGRDGNILHKNTDVNAASDSKSVLKAVRQLTASTQ